MNPHKEATLAPQNLMQPHETQPPSSTTLENKEVVVKISQVENIIADVLSCTNNAASSVAEAAATGAIKRAQTKNRMMPFMGSGLVLAALDEVAWEVANAVSSANSTNVALMRQLTEGLKRPEEHLSITTARQPEGLIAAAPPLYSAGSSKLLYGPREWDRSTSVRSQRGEPPTPASIDSAAAEEEEESPVSTSDSPEQQHPSSVFTINGSEESNEDLESTGKTADLATADLARSIMAPLREFAEQLCREHNDTNCLEFKKTSKLLKPKSGDLRFAREVDFDQCSSPRAAGSLGTPSVKEACFEFGYDSSVKPIRGEPIDQGIDQFSPMAPKTPGGGDRGTGKVVVLKGEIAPEHRHFHLTSATSSQGSSPRASPLVSVAAAPSAESTTTTTTTAAAARAAAPIQHQHQKDLRSVGSSFGCEAGVPPGLNPSARVEGSRISAIVDQFEESRIFANTIPPPEFGSDLESATGVEELPSQFQSGLGM